ncbi:TPA: hypothetical protein ACFP41_001797 [Neisseria weaveri]
MAELILTEEEKQAASYLDWSDEALGKLVRKIAANLKNEKEGIKVTATAMLLVGFIAETGSTSAEFKMDNITQGETELGNWIIKVSKNA